MAKAIYRSPALTGAFWMVMAGVVYAAGNVAIQQVTMNMGFAASSVAFWQYGIALVFAVPYLWRTGLSVMRTSHPWQHVFRVALSALGVQAWAIGLASVPISQAIALVMTSPFFIIVGAKLFLGETVGPSRWIATAVGFTGALLILQPWSESFTWAALLPIASALLWGGTSLITKRLTAHERPESITVWLLMLLTPIFVPVAMAAGIDPVHLGVIITLNITIALITPPMGACVFVAAAVSKLEITSLFRTIWPFVLLAVAVLLMLIIFPPLTLWLPTLSG